MSSSANASPSFTMGQIMDGIVSMQQQQQQQTQASSAPSARLGQTRTITLEDQRRTGGTEHIVREVPTVVPTEVEVIREVPKEVVREVIKEVVKEVPVEVPVEVIKEVPVEVVRTVIKEVPKETIKEVPVEVIKEVIVEAPREVIKEVEVVKEGERTRPPRHLPQPIIPSDVSGGWLRGLPSLSTPHPLIDPCASAVLLLQSR